MNDVRWMELTEKLRKHEDAQRLLFTWAKTGVVTQKEFCKLLDYYCSCVRPTDQPNHYW